MVSLPPTYIMILLQIPNNAKVTRPPGTTGMPYINNWKNIRKMIKYSGTYYFYGMEDYYETD
jgi:hypothetical protein